MGSHMKVIDRAVADAAWTILVEHCAAREDGRAEFVASVTRRSEGSRNGEYRFGGALGFGGKFWWDTMPLAGRPALRVSCYREDMSAERRAMIDAANARLAALL
jgi:hypothetical protein